MLWILLIFAALVFWLMQLRHVMTMKDEEFEGRNDKLIWFIFVFFGSVIGAFLFYFWKHGREQEKVEARKLEKFIKDQQ